MTRTVLDPAAPDVALLDAAPLGARLIASYLLREGLPVQSTYVKVTTGDRVWPTAWLYGEDGHLIYSAESFTFPHADRVSLHVPGRISVAIEGDRKRGWLCNVPGCVDDHKSGLDSISEAIDDARAHLTNHAELERIVASSCIVDRWGSNLSPRIEVCCRTHGSLGLVPPDAAQALLDAHLRGSSDV